MGTTRVLHYVFIQTQCVDEWKRMLYAVWRVPSSHSTDCYYCMVPRIQNGMSMNKKINTCVSEYTISNSTCASWQWTSCS